MTLQNRVMPTGQIIAHPARGTIMGNRGILHDDSRTLGAARWRHRAWIACVLAFKDRHRTVMMPGRYTELFFHDEAVALAAGHRPCAECRRADYLRFRSALAAGCAELGPAPRAAEMDRLLHAARIVPGTRQHRVGRADTADLPDGCFVAVGAVPILLWKGRGFAWAPGRYHQVTRPAGAVDVLTPEPIVAALRAGYVPSVVM